MAVDYALIEDIDTDVIEPVPIIYKKSAPPAQQQPKKQIHNMFQNDGTECNILVMLFVAGALYIMMSN
jgi:hypothetical protein